MFSLLGMLVAVGSALTYLALMVYRMTTLPMREALLAMLDRDILEFFLIGMVLLVSGWSANTSDASICRCVTDRAT